MTKVLGLAMFGALLLIAAQPAAALTACTAADISAQEAACPPGAGITCVVTKQYTVANACTLDFGTRNVILASTARLSIGSGTITLLANSLILQSHSRIEGQGGSVTIRTGGSMTLEELAEVDVSASSDVASVGGYIEIATAGDFSMASGAQMLAEALGPEGSGGEIYVEVGLVATVFGDLSSNGSDMAGSVELLARGGVAILGTVSAAGSAGAGSGGAIKIEAGYTASGNLTISGHINVGAGPCDAIGDCGDAGYIELNACNIDVQTGTEIFARATGFGGGGDISLRAREQATINGMIDARSDPGGSDGQNMLVFQSSKPPVISSGAFRPVAATVGQPKCTAVLQTDCLIPCPTCGDNTIEYPETCDGGNASNCDGCSRFCTIETCGAGFACVCDATVGCGPNAPCNPPATGTPTPTPTPSPAIVVSNAAARPGGLLCLAASLSNGGSPLSTTNEIGYPAPMFPLVFSAVMINPAIGPATAPNKQVSRMANSGNDTYTVSGMNMIGIPNGTLYTAKYVIPAGALVGTYNVPLPAPGFEVAITTCTGDCNGNGAVGLGELQRCVRIFLGQPICDLTTPSRNCPVADTDNLGSVSMAELQGCISRFLIGCH